MIRVKFTGVMAPPARVTVIRNVLIIIGGRVIILQSVDSFLLAKLHSTSLWISPVDIENLCAFRIFPYNADQVLKLIQVQITIFILSRIISLLVEQVHTG